MVPYYYKNMYEKIYFDFMATDDRERSFVERDER